MDVAEPVDDSEQHIKVHPMSVQQYIDELPTWSDGTVLESAPMTSMQWFIWSLAAAGKFFEGFVVFMTGVALPLIAREFHITSAEHGLVSAASLFGILIGAIGLGGLADHFGRKRMFVTEMVIFTAFLAILMVSTNIVAVILCLFGLGLALGCDYPTAHMIISENTPSRVRGRLVLAAFAFQAVGALAGTGAGYLVLRSLPELGSWRWMFAIALVPALAVTIARIFVPESAQWLYARGSLEAAQRALARLLERRPKYPRSFSITIPGTDAATSKPRSQSFGALFNAKNRRATILASVPWFLQDLSTYGIGIFTPTILATAIGGMPDQIRSTADVIASDIAAAEGAALITSLLLVGIAFAVFLADVLGRIKLQIAGFIGCAVGLFIASLSVDVKGGAGIFLIFAGFMLFNFMTNLGPNAQTYLIAGEVFPTKIRAMGAGFAASFAKIGAVTTAFLFPILLDTIGTRTLLYLLVISSVIGAWMTWRFRIETSGTDLETIGDQTARVVVVPVAARSNA